MTTLAYDGRLIAVDSQITQGDTKYTSRKVWEVSTPDGQDLVVWGTGTVPHIHACISALKEGRKMPTGDYTLFVVGFQDGPVEFCGADEACPVPYALYAAGSGSQAALGAMKAGADAARAVEIACTVDTNTGGPVVVYDLKTRKFRPSRSRKTTP